MTFNEDPTVSCDQLFLYAGEMTLLPHQGEPRSGSGTVHLRCGGGVRCLQVLFSSTDGKLAYGLPPSPDNRYGKGTSLMRLASSKDFYLFVTAGSHDPELVGESKIIQGDENLNCDRIDVYLINCLIPAANTDWIIDDWLVSVTRTRCAYDLARISIPTHEVNLTRKLSFRRINRSQFRWSDLAADLDRLCIFLSFANCSPISAPIAYGYCNDEIEFFRFEVPRRSTPKNRRSWATYIDENDLASALSQFRKKMENEFWANVLERVINWQTLAELSSHDSTEQALFTVQMSLELLSFVLLVEDTKMLSEAGYGKLPAFDKISLLGSRSNQDMLLGRWHDVEAVAFCGANSIANIPELITTIRNKLIHPTKKNREFLEQVPPSVRRSAVELGLQVVSLTILKILGYGGSYFDVRYHKRTVPWLG